MSSIFDLKTLIPKEDVDEPMSKEQWSELKKGDHFKYKRMGTTDYKYGYVLEQIEKDGIKKIKAVMTRDELNKPLEQIISFALDYNTLDVVQRVTLKKADKKKAPSKKRPTTSDLEKKMTDIASNIEQMSARISACEKSISDLKKNMSQVAAFLTKLKK